MPFKILARWGNFLKILNKYHLAKLPTVENGFWSFTADFTRLHPLNHGFIETRTNHHGATLQKMADPCMPRFTHGEPTQYHRSLRTAKAMTDFVLALDRDPMLEAVGPREQKASKSCRKSVRNLRQQRNTLQRFTRESCTATSVK